MTRKPPCDESPAEAFARYLAALPRRRPRPAPTRRDRVREWGLGVYFVGGGIALYALLATAVGRVMGWW